MEWLTCYVAVEDDWGMLRRALAKEEPQPIIREKLLTKLQIQWAHISQQEIQNFSHPRGEGYANAQPNAMVIHTIDLIFVIFSHTPTCLN